MAMAMVWWVVIGVLVPGVAWLAAGRRIALESMRPGPPVPVPDLERQLPGRAPVRIPVKESEREGFAVFPEGRPHGIVLLVHGWGSDAANMAPWARFLAEAGWASLAFDLRGHGRRPESVGMPHLAEDIRAACRFLAGHPTWGSLPRFALGHSMGGGALLLALASGADFRGGIISSVFARTETLTDYVLRRRGLPPALFHRVIRATWERRLGVSLEPLEPERTIATIRRPLLLAHGEADPIIPRDDLMRLQHAAKKEVAEVLEVPGATHSDLPGHALYREGVVRFLHRCLSGQGE